MERDYLWDSNHSISFRDRIALSVLERHAKIDLADLDHDLADEIASKCFLMADAILRKSNCRPESGMRVYINANEPRSESPATDY